MKDPHALSLLNRMISTVGGLPTLQLIEDYKESGTITYFWAGQPINAVATVRGRGAAHFRLDSELASGIRTVGVSRLASKLKDEHGSVTEIPLHNAVNMGAITLPVLKVIAALQDPAATITYVGPLPNGDEKIVDVRIQWPFPDAAHSIPALSHLTATDFLIDSQTSLLTEIHTISHPRGTLTRDIPEIYELSDYRPVNGILVPHTIINRLNGQQIWVLHVQKVEFDIGLSNADFDF
ncbi:MAG TPA: hypothetical protein VG759_27520 [Candidatus Angelobacter sp.]|nr:hypothetical protein [Candidatus Angelobacter sp.]